MNKTDIEILSRLQDDGRLTNVALSEQICLSPSPCLRRVKQLEQSGVIQGYHARVDRQKAGFSMTIFVEVRLNTHEVSAHTAFETAMIDMQDIVSAHLVSGTADYSLEVVAIDLNDYEGILKRLQGLPHVKDIQSHVAIRCVKSAAPLPLTKVSR
ncbi:Lrp/AsnC family transcriptional regulator [Agarivorans sp. QJM3NY_33]|uniref:Lrp/AsnC family transcriptional regulator n=1 Tax=Agarivorans sp. QJM3NY_33 TaxID=3421432 RepID=UPI003D7EFCFD